MKKSDPHNEVLAAFHKAQQEMGKLTKDSVNPHFKSEYASLEAVIDTANKAYQKNGLILTQEGEAMPSGDGINIITTILHTSGQWLESNCPVFMSKKDAQTTGSAISYGRRYGIKNLANLTEKDDDDDGGAASDIDQSKRRDEETLRPITDTQMEEAQHLFTLLKASDEKIKSTCLKFSTDGGKFKKLSTPQQYIEAMMKSEASAMVKHLDSVAKKEGL